MAKAEAPAPRGTTRRRAPATSARRTRPTGKPAAPAPNDPAPALPRAERPAQAGRVLTVLLRAWPDANCSLAHRNAFELLVSTILSAQCTDERVNMVTPKLFARYPGPAEMATANPRSLEAVIRSTGFFRNKAKSVRAAAQLVAERHGGKVPRSMDELLQLPGVARKTANVVLGTAYGVADGVVVDTHVFRVSRRLGLTGEETPEKVEADLMALFPRDRWIWLSHAFIQHGRRICIARRPLCEECPMNTFCPSNRVAGEAVR